MFPMRFSMLPLLLLAAACNEQSPSQAPAGGLEGIHVPPPPAALCAQSAAALEKLGGKGVIDYDDKANATIPQELWMAMGDQHNPFAQTLALHAACTHPDGSAERKVTIRNENGVILMEAMIPTNIGLGSISPE
jgi:hypothetical protein